MDDHPLALAKEEQSEQSQTDQRDGSLIQTDGIAPIQNDDTERNADLVQIPNDNIEQNADSVEIQNPVAVQIPTSFANLPPGILEKIFRFVPANDRLVVASICHSWRCAFLGTSSCWHGTTLGRNSNRYSTAPPSIHLADYFPLTHVEEVRFTPAIPAVMHERPNFETDPVSSQLKEIPHSWLELILRRACKLKRLDLSLLEVADENAADFR